MGSEQMEGNPAEQHEESELTVVDANENILGKLHSSQFFQKRRQMFRSCPSKVEKEFDQTDPSLPEGFRVREKVRGDGVRKDREFLNSEGTLIFRSKPAVLEYLKIMEGDTVKEDDEHHFIAETS